MEWKQEAFAQRPAGSPLSPHVKGWCKSIGGKLVIVAGKVPHAEAMKKYHVRMAKIITADQSGGVSAPVATAQVPVAAVPVAQATPVLVTPPVPARRTITVQQVKDRFLAYKTGLCKRGKLTATALAAIEECAGRYARRHGDRAVDSLTTADFTTYRTELEDHFSSPYSIQRHVTQVKAMFRWAADDEQRLIPGLPRWGKNFCNPSDSEKEKHRGKIKRQYGLSLFEPADIGRILDVATPVERAIVLLGLNCAYGNNDISSLTKNMVNLDRGLIDYPRVKTGAERRAFLWPETAAALEAAIPLRPAAAKDEYGDLVFLSPTGLPWVRGEYTAGGKVMRNDELTYLFSQLQKRAGTYREKRGFYALRRTFDTVAAETNETMARLRVMGHKLVGMDGHYVQSVKDSKIKAVVDHVRGHFADAIAPPTAHTQVSGDGMFIPILDLD